MAGAIFLLVCSVLSGLVAFGALNEAKTSIHQIGGFVIALSAVVFFCAAILTSIVDHARKTLTAELRSLRLEIGRTNAAMSARQLERTTEE